VDPSGLPFESTAARETSALSRGTPSQRPPRKVLEFCVCVCWGGGGSRLGSVTLSGVAPSSASSPSCQMQNGGAHRWLANRSALLRRRTNSGSLAVGGGKGDAQGMQNTSVVANSSTDLVRLIYYHHHIYHIITTNNTNKPPGNPTELIAGLNLNPPSTFYLSLNLVSWTCNTPPHHHHHP